MLYVLSRSVGQSRIAGLASALGLALGGILLAVVAASGLAVIFQRSPLLYQTVTTLGALYIVYLGAELLWEMRRDSNNLETGEIATDEIKLDEVEREQLFRIVYQGVLVELLNPKTVLFFMAFIPPFVDPTQGDVTAQLLILGLLVPLTALPSDLVVAFVGGTVAERLKTNTSGARALNIIGAVMLIAIGVSVFFY